MTFHGLDNESLRLEMAGSFSGPNGRDRNANRLLMFIEVKCTAGWWVSFDTTITVGEMKRLGAWFNILSKDKRMINRRFRVGKEALSFGYYPIKKTRGLLFVNFSKRLAPGRRRAVGEFFSATANHVMCRFRRTELKQIAATLRRELSKHAVKHPARLQEHYKAVKVG